MKKIIALLLFTCILFACNNDGKTEADTDATNLEQPLIDTPAHVRDSNFVQTDTSILDTSRTILRALRDLDIETLSRYIHPALRLRFSPYAYVDTTESQAFTPYQLKMAVQKSTVLHWGSYDGTGDSIDLSIQDYFKRFVYKGDFLNAPQRSINNFVVSGNTINNLLDIYPNSIFTEFYFPGFEERYDGMDWEALRLVFQSVQGKLYLVAVVHDQWTI